MNAKLLPAACGVLVTGGLFLITWTYAAASSSPGAVAFAVLLVATVVAGAITGQFVAEVIRTYREGAESASDSPADRIESLGDAHRLILDWLKEPLPQPRVFTDADGPEPPRLEKQEPTL